MKYNIVKSEDQREAMLNFGRYKKSFIVLVFVLSGYSVALNASDYIIDKNVSRVSWEGKKVTGKHNGTISIENGLIFENSGQITGGTCMLDMKSIVDDDITNPNINKKLIGHLSSDDFFSVEKFPESKIEIKKVTPVAGDEYRFLADLTIKGITNPVEFNAKIQVNGDTLNAEGVIIVNRTLYGIKYGSGHFFDGLGDKMIYDDFTLSFDVVALKK